MHGLLSKKGFDEFVVFVDIEGFHDLVDHLAGQQEYENMKQ